PPLPRRRPSAAHLARQSPISQRPRRPVPLPVRRRPLCPVRRAGLPRASAGAGGVPGPAPPVAALGVGGGDARPLVGRPPPWPRRRAAAPPLLRRARGALASAAPALRGSRAGRPRRRGGLVGRGDPGQRRAEVLLDGARVAPVARGRGGGQLGRQG